MTTNYRQYYERDPNFYLTVLEKEEPGVDGHEFKMHIFRNDGSTEPFGTNFELNVADVLSNYDAVNVRVSTMQDRKDKLRVNFRIKDKEKAKQCYIDFHNSS